jgi:MFS family permease
LLAPVIEGALGGWSTLQSATSAYLSDCTSSGSRAAIFSRFSGVFYVGLSVGPSLGGYLIKHPLWTRTEANGVLTVTSVFWVAIVSSFINFILVLFIFPESLDKVKRIRAAEQQRVESNAKGKGQPGDLEEEAGESSGQGVDIPIKKRRGLLRKFFRPLGVFRPALVSDGEGRKRKDWSLTMLGMVTFGYMLAQVGSTIQQLSLC